MGTVRIVVDGIIVHEATKEQNHIKPVAPKNVSKIHSRLFVGLAQNVTCSLAS
jgi:hypothetical protein